MAEENKENLTKKISSGENEIVVYSNEGQRDVQVLPLSIIS